MKRPKRRFLFLLAVAAVALSLLLVTDRYVADEPALRANPTPQTGASQNGTIPDSTIENSTIQVATFAGGCFWCMEAPFDKIKGVTSTIPGYTGGRTENPVYDQVKTGRTGHIESLQVKYDSAIVSYEQLLWLFWHNVDPTQANGQFCDEGNQYRTLIFYHDDEQKQLAETTDPLGWP